MKPLSKRQRETLQKLKDGDMLRLNLRNEVSFYSSGERIHSAVYLSLLENDCIQQIPKPDGAKGVFFYITSSGLTALAKPTRNRGKKKKPVIESAHEKIMV